MQTILQQQADTTYVESQVKVPVLTRFMRWSESQEKYRFGWLAFILTSHGCVLTPLTLFAVILSGASLPLFIAVIVAMGMALVTNLAAMPTKVTIPVFFLSILIDVAVVVACAVLGFQVAGAGI